MYNSNIYRGNCSKQLHYGYGLAVDPRVCFHPHHCIRNVEGLKLEERCPHALGHVG